MSKIFKTKIFVNFFDCDPAGIMFFANLFRHAHTAYEKFFDSLDLDRNYFADHKYVLPIIHSSADFKKPVTAHDELNVSVSVKKIKSSSFELGYKFYSSNGSLTAEAATVHVCVDKSNFGKTTIPENLKESLGQYIE